MSQPNELTQQVFAYEQLDESTSDFLRSKESNMREIVGKAYTELGQELTEARDKLAGSNQYDGVFIKWVESIGMERRQVTRLIQRYEMLGTLCPDRSDLIEDLPVTLSYDIAKPSAESTPEKAQAKAEVLGGEIATGKAYKERIAELEEQREEEMRRAGIERKERERLEVEVSGLHETNVELAEKADKPAEIKLEYVEVEKETNNTGDYKEIRKERDELGTALSGAYVELRELRKLKKSVQHEKQSPLYDMYRSLTSVEGIIQVFTEDERMSANLVVNSDKDVVDRVKGVLRRVISYAEQAQSIIDGEDVKFINVETSQIVDAEYTEIVEVKAAEQVEATPLEDAEETATDEDETIETINLLLEEQSEVTAQDVGDMTNASNRQVQRRLKIFHDNGELEANGIIRKKSGKANVFVKLDSEEDK